MYLGFIKVCTHIQVQVASTSNLLETIFKMMSFLRKRAVYILKLKSWICGFFFNKYLYKVFIYCHVINQTKVHLIIPVILMHSFVPFQIFYPDLIDKTDTPEYTLVSHLSFLRTYNYCEKRLFLILDTNVHVGLY